MRLIFFMVFATSCLANDDETNHLSSASKTLDSNLRKALLKALTELETESGKGASPESTVEKAQASVISFVQESPIASSTSTTKAPPITKQVVLIQKSAAIQHKPITTFIPSNQTEQLVTAQTNYRNKVESTSPNSVSVNDKLSKIDLASPTPTVETPTTEESQAKVEDVQFFSAPLVAAFTVHQDEHGLPKSVEPIYKSSTNTVPVVTNFIDDQRYYQRDYYARQEQLKQEQLNQELLKQQQFKQEQYRNQLVIQEKQRALEEQLYKLQRQQRQQQEFLLKQQELIKEQERMLKEERERYRLKHNDQPFVPIIPSHINNNVDFTTPSPSKPSTVVFQSSVSFNPAEFSKETLPLNAQQLPVKNFNEFRQSPYNFNQVQPNQIQSNQFQPNQFHPNQIQSNRFQPHQIQHNQIQANQPIQVIPSIQPNQQVQTIQSVQSLPAIQPIQSFQSIQPLQTVQQIQPILTPPHATNAHHYTIPTAVDVPPTQNVRIYRQEQGTGNVANNFGYNPNPHYAQVQIQPSVQINPNLRLLRSNLEGLPNGPVQPPVVNHQLRNLLHQAGISKGRQEDLNIVSKVLSYNHFGGDNFFAGAPGRTYQFPIHRSDTKV